MTQKRPPLFDDEQYQDHLTKVLQTNAAALQQCNGLLSGNDFKPVLGHRWGNPRWVVAERCLNYFRQHGEPVRELLRADVLDYAHELRLGSRQVTALKNYLVHLDKVSIVPAEAVVDKFVQFKTERLKAAVLEEMVQLHTANELTSEKWHEMTEKALGDVSAQTSVPASAPWPEPLGQKALHGLAGDFVRLVEPHTEADPAALLVQFLVAFGNVVGHEPYFVAEETQHHLNLFTVIVGSTSQSRKGTSWARVKARFCPLDLEWKVKSGAVSGEGVIEQFRDASSKEL